MCVLGLKTALILLRNSNKGLPVGEKVISYIQFRGYGATSSKEKQRNYDVAVIGAGIVGLATARELIFRYPNLSFLVLDKESKLAAHQSGHNSGVIHAGIYYTPGSLKARLCVEGLRLAYKYCDENQIPYKKCGKLIVATSQEQIGRLDDLYVRGQKNNVPDLRVVNADQIREIEPYCKGVKALYSPQTGIVDWAEVARSYAKNFAQSGGQIFLDHEVTKFGSAADPNFPVTITSRSKGVDVNVNCKYAIVCAGLQADRMAEKSGCASEPKILPFRGDYLLLKPEKHHLVRGNIYPVPDPRFPFLGVHFTPRINGEVWLGPNAVLAFKREGYRLFDFNPRDFVEAVGYSGLRKLVMKNASYTAGELYRGVFISATVKQLQEFVPELQRSDVTRGPSGVRAQALDVHGKLVDDFVFDSGKGDIAKRMLHVRNAPSPAATSSLAIAKMIANEAATHFGLPVKDK